MPSTSPVGSPSHVHANGVTPDPSLPPSPPPPRSPSIRPANDPSSSNEGHYTLDDRGKYSPDDSGKYTPDNSGSYTPDNSGKYKPDHSGDYNPGSSATGGSTPSTGRTREGKSPSFDPGDTENRTARGLGDIFKGNFGTEAAKLVAQRYKRGPNDPRTPQTPYENERQEAMQDVYGAMQKNRQQMFEGGDMASGELKRQADGKFVVPKEVDDAVNTLGKVTQDPDLSKKFQNKFLPLMNERNEHARLNPADKQPELRPDQRDYFGTREHVRYGMDAQRDLFLGRNNPTGDERGTETHETLSAGSPELAAMLNPTGGLVGPGNNEFIPWKQTNDQLLRHSELHDAGGYARLNHRAGPGYNYEGPGGPIGSSQSPESSTSGQQLLFTLTNAQSRPIVETSPSANREYGPNWSLQSNGTHPYR